MRSISLRRLLSISFATIVIILILLLSFIIGQRSIKEVQSEIGNSLGESAFLMGDKLDHFMWSRYGEIGVLSELQDLRDPEDLNDVKILLDQLKATFADFAWIGYTDKNGTVRASTSGILEGVDISERPVYKEAQNDTFIGDVHEAILLAELLPNPTGEEMKFVDISTPIYNYNDEFIGVLAAHLSWDWMKEVRSTMTETLKNKKELEVFVISESDKTIILGPDDLIGEPLDLESLSAAEVDQGGWNIEIWPDGEEYLTGYVKTDGYQDYRGLGWTILVRQPTEVAYSSTRELITFFLISGVLLVILFALIGWFIAGKIASPIKRITNVADRLRDGEDLEIPTYKGIVEIEILSDSLRNLINNLTQTETALEKMEDVAHQDHLTRLPNRNGLENFLDKATKNFDTLIILYLDLDGFKEINDTFGHQVGDELLYQIGIRIKANVRNDELVARIGGDEFVVVLTTSNDPLELAENVGERIISSINQPITINNQKVTVGCSIGGAVWRSEHGDSITEIVRRADEALYKVKRKQKNKVHILNEE
ncbi:sensor domain-containing diguanylate cyclase [Saliterribacillus persicus]|uniref:sensor domain-containing diguanylate cyclase n=1 Tax=Saliterribacillus persicus TaxID=930114 RepID=UPI000DF2D50B|nr:sensor domain-containing diguanylate cyclase [Saliterribacillus persicus]